MKRRSPARPAGRRSVRSPGPASKREPARAAPVRCSSLLPCMYLRSADPNRDHHEPATRPRAHIAGGPPSPDGARQQGGKCGSERRSASRGTAGKWFIYSRFRRLDEVRERCPSATAFPLRPACEPASGCPPARYPQDSYVPIQGLKVRRCNHFRARGTYCRRAHNDNNASERVLRGPVIARYTCFGSGGPDGARVAGLMFGVVRDAAPGRAESLHLGAGLSRRLRRQPRPAAGAAGPVAALADGRGPQARTPRPPRPPTRHRPPCFPGSDRESSARPPAGSLTPAGQGAALAPAH